MPDSQSDAVIELVTRFGDEQLKTRGNRLVYPADEWYVKAGRAIPDEEFYGEMSQLENGVGLTALLRAQFAEAMAQRTETRAVGTPTVIATGMAAAATLRELVAQASEVLDNVCTEVVPIRNDFFGETITVAGLVTGSDLRRQLQGIPCKRVLIPDCMLRHEGDRFLDDVTPEQLAADLAVEVEVIPTDGAALWDALVR